MKKIEFLVKNIFLNILLFINRSPKSKKDLTLSPSSKILFIRLNRIGDALVTTPLISAVKKSTKCKIHILSDKKN